MRSKIVSALASVALMAAPTMAVAQPAPASETVEGSELRGGGRFGQILPILVIIAIVFAIRELVRSNDPGQNPISP